MTKGGLGNGADALFSTMDSIDAIKTSSRLNTLPNGITQDDDGILWADINMLKPNPYQPRKKFAPEPLKELSQSIKEQGIIQAINVEETTDGFLIISGERRVQAAKMAGLDRVPVVLRHYNEQTKLEVALIENIQRENLNPIEEAQAYCNLMTISNLTQEDIATRVGKNRATVANALRLLKLPDDMQHSIAMGQVSSGHARALLAIQSEDNQREMYNKIIADKITVRKAEKLAKDYNRGLVSARKANKNKETADNDLKAFEQSFIDMLGTKVSIKGDWNKGVLQIDYYSKEDLERIRQLLANHS